ncbi:hypothetical protein D0Z03_002122 [Geotrichum reessii]|nr:hypothetical protein D0Z03_002122 [Galactomyces reessii]
MAETDELIDDIFTQFLSEPSSPAARYTSNVSNANDDNDDDDTDPTISISHLPDIITALDLDESYSATSAPTKYAAIKKALDPIGGGRICRQTFHEIIPFLLEESVADNQNDDNLDDDIIGNDIQKVKGKGSDDSSSRVSRESVYQDFLLFTEGQDRPIVLADLKRVSAELKDNAPVELLANMMQLKPPSGSTVGGHSDPHSISFEEFDYIMRMAKSI